MDKPKGMTIKEIAEAVIKELEEKDIEELKSFDATKSYQLHHGLGVFIRNKYIYAHPENPSDYQKTLGYHPDNVSDEIVKKILRILKAKKK